jgi:DNA-binding CsgD family transcriptional regulator
MKLDVIGAVEACYASRADEGAWLDGILAALEPLDQGLGLYAQIFRWSPAGAWSLERSVVKGAFPAEALVEVASRNRVMPRDMLQRIYAPGVGYALRREPQLRQIGADLFRGAGMDDAVGAIASEPDGRSVLVAIPIRSGGRYLPPRTLHQLTLLSAHLGSGLRLRRALGVADGHGSAREAEAVLDPKGRALDAHGEAKERSGRERLSEAAHRMEQARGRLRRADPDEALRLWQGLVHGTWSLVDCYDADGKRYLIARRNEPGVTDPLALTPRERAVLAFAAMGHQNKYIAYLLGLPDATVSNCLAGAQRKLKVESRSELICRFAGVVRQRSDTPRSLAEPPRIAE